MKPGSQIGPYEVLAPLGAGGMGEVYRARDRRIGRDVAIKILPNRGDESKDRAHRFEQEARTAGILNHPNLLTVHDVGSVEGSLFIVSELVDGTTLRETMKEGPLSVRRATDYALQIAQGLAAAHDRGVVHRDLKPENLIVTRDGRVKILDFGLAKLMATSPITTQDDDTAAQLTTDPGMVLGTLAYMPPEQIRAQDIDPRADIFALGAILYEMLSGQRAFKGASAADTMSAILREEPAELSSLRAEISPALDRIVRHCLEKNRDQRFQSARDLAFALEAISTSSSSSTHFDDLSASEKRKRGGVAMIAIGAFSAGALVSALATILLRPTPAPPVAPTLRTLTYSGSDHTPDVAPDGKTMVFVSDRDGIRKLWLKQLPSGGEVVLTQGPDYEPRYSPDGTVLLFTHDSGSKPAIYRTDVVGGMPRRIVSEAESADWSHDGTSIVWTHQITSESEFHTLVGRARPDGSESHVIADVRGGLLAYPRFSPSGASIVLTETTPGNRELALMLLSSDGKERRRLLPPAEGGAISSAVWLDEQHLLYAQAESLTNFKSATGSRIVLHDIKSGESRVVLHAPGIVTSIVKTSDGRILFDSLTLRESIQQCALNGVGSATALSRGSSADRQPVYSRDGEWVAFSSNRSGGLDLWAVSTKSGAVNRITDDAADDFDPFFTTKGDLLWSSARGGHFEVWTAASDGSGARALSNDGVDAENPTTADGQWIIYNSYNPQKGGIWKMRADGSEATRVYAGTTELPEVSPDGKFATFRTTDSANELRVVRLSDHASYPFVHLRDRRFGSPVAPGRSRWMPDGKSIVFVDNDAQGRTMLFTQQFDFGHDTSSTQRLLPLPDFGSPPESFGISPDGTRIAIAVNDQTSSIIAAEGMGGMLNAKR